MLMICKIIEVIYVLVMEVKYFKDEIFLIYLNCVYMGGGVYGVEVVG